MKKALYILPVLLLIASTACKQPASNKDKKEVEEATEIESVELDTEESDDLLHGELREFGIIENIEDGAYPFFVVTVNFVQLETKIDFNLNIEAITLGHEDLINQVGKYATIYYISELESSLNDLQLEGTSLFGEFAPEYDSNWDQITGILNGADQVTSGDLPSMISITDSEGKKMDFELFIDEETVKANGKTVDAFFGLRGVHTITRIIPSEE